MMLRKADDLKVWFNADASYGIVRRRRSTVADRSVVDSRELDSEMVQHLARCRLILIILAEYFADCEELRARDGYITP